MTPCAALNALLNAPDTIPGIEPKPPLIRDLTILTAPLIAEVIPFQTPDINC